MPRALGISSRVLRNKAASNRIPCSSLAPSLLQYLKPTGASRSRSLDTKHTAGCVHQQRHSEGVWAVHSSNSAMPSTGSGTGLEGSLCALCDRALDKFQGLMNTGATIACHEARKPSAAGAVSGQWPTAGKIVPTFS